MKKIEKGSRKSCFWQFPRSKEGKNAKTKKKMKKK